jgi:hypothetical protein
MPFTVSHAAAAYPLRRILGRHAVWSALIIGTAMPDIPYFLPLGVPRWVSHSELGLFYYCLPLGLVLYVLFHRVLKQPLVALLPKLTRVRLDSRACDGNLPASSWTAVALSILIGAASHLAWDAFTHGDAKGVEWVPVLSEPLAAVGDYTLHGHTFLQHASTLFGLLVLFIGLWRWHRRTPLANYPPRATLSLGKRLAVLALLVVVPGVWAAATALETLSGAFHMQGLQRAAGVSLIAGLRAFGVSVILYGVLWQLRQRWGRARRASAAILDR